MVEGGWECGERLKFGGRLEWWREAGNVVKD